MVIKTPWIQRERIDLAIGKIVFLVFTVLALFYVSKISGIFVEPQWEHVDAVTADNTVAKVTYDIVFDKYMPDKCENGIYVSDGEKKIPFEIIESNYSDGMCFSAKIQFDNSIYGAEGESAESESEQAAEQQPSASATEEVSATVPEEPAQVPQKAKGITEIYESTERTTITGQTTEFSEFKTYYIFYGAVTGTPAPPFKKTKQISEQTQQEVVQSPEESIVPVPEIQPQPAEEIIVNITTNITANETNVTLPEISGHAFSGNGFSGHLKNTVNSEDMVYVEFGQGALLNFGIISINGNTPNVVNATTEDGKIIYENILQNISLEYYSTSDSLKETFVLYEKPDTTEDFIVSELLSFSGVNEFSLYSNSEIVYSGKKESITLSSLVKPQNSSDVKFKSAAIAKPASKILIEDVGKTIDTVETTQDIDLSSAAGTVFYIPAGTAFDSNNASTDVTYVMSKQNGKTKLDIIVDSAWLLDKARVYPVYIDPSITMFQPRTSEIGWINDQQLGYQMYAFPTFYNTAGDFVVTWINYTGTDGVTNALKAKKFDSFSTINETSEYDFTQCSEKRLPEVYSGIGNANQIYITSTAASEAGGEILSVYTSGVDPNNDAYMTWERPGDASETISGDSCTNGGGAAARPTMRMSETTSGNQLIAYAAASTDGERYGACWQNYMGSYPDNEIIFKLWNGTETGSNYQNHQIKPSSNNNCGAFCTGNESSASGQASADRDLTCIMDFQVNSTNDFTVCWVRYDGARYNGLCRVFNSTGTAKAAAFTYEATANSVRASDVVWLDDQRFVVAYSEFSSPAAVKFSIYFANGTAIAADTVVNNTGTLNKYWPSVARLENGNFVYVYQADFGGTNSNDILGAIYFKNGTLASSASHLVINENRANAQTYPRVESRNGTNEYLVTWQSQNDSNWDGVRMRLFGSKAPSISSLIINSSSGTNTTSENVTAYANSTDPDNDYIFHTFNWKKNGAPIAVGLWPFDSNDDKSAKDYAEKGNDGYLGNGAGSYVPTWTEDGKRGGAYTFSSSVNNYVTITDRDSMDTGQELTISMWVKFSSTASTYDTWLSRGPQGATGFIWFMLNGNNMYYQYSNGAAAVGVETSAQTWTIGQWYHLAVTSSNVTKRVVFYKDGALVGNLSIASVIVPVTTGDTYLGTYAGGPTSASYRFMGTMDDVRFYNQAITPEQINQIYSEDSEVLKMTFDRNDLAVNSSVRDISGNNNDGVVSGGVTWNASGKVKGAYSFDGVDDVINKTYSASDGLSFGTGNFTIEAWIYPKSATDGAIFLTGITGSGGGGNSGYYLSMDSTRKLHFVAGTYSTSGYPTFCRLSDTLVNLNQWTHVAAVRTSTGVQIYLNGTAVTHSGCGYPGSGDTNYAGAVASSICNRMVGSCFRPCGDTNGNILKFNGTIDEVKVYNRALTAEQVSLAYKEGAYGYSSTLVSQELAIGDKWSATVTPNDLFSDGDSSTSANLTVLTETNLVACANLTVANTVYTMTQNATADAWISCMQFKANNVTLDCAGYWIKGSTVYQNGIAVNDVKNATIKDCVILGAEGAFYTYNSTNVTLMNITTIDSTYYSFWSYKVSNLSINNSRFSGQTATDSVYKNFELEETNNSYINNSAILDTEGYNVYILDSDRNYFVNVTINQSSRWDIYSDTLSSDNTFINLTTCNSTGLSFTYAGDIRLSGKCGPPPNTGAAYVSMNGFIEIENTSASWIYLNSSYSHSSEFFENIMQFWKLPTTFNYQENATSYACSGKWMEPGGCNKVIDNNWNTYNHTNGSFVFTSISATIAMNYTKWSNATAYPIWQVKDEGGTVNLSVPYDCWSAYSNVLSFKAVSYFAMTVPSSTFTATWYCYTNEGVWKSLRAYSGSYNLYEEGLFWQVQKSDWTNDTGTPNSVDTVNNRVYANITKFGSIFAPKGEMTTNITSCRDLLLPRAYVLTADINRDINDGRTVCINILANNVTLDCQNHNIDGNAIASAIGSSGYNNSVIKNCRINDSGTGITLDYVYNSTMDNITTVSAMTDYATDIFESNNTIIKNCNFTGLSGASTRCIYYPCAGWGGCGNNSAINNTLNNCGENGIYLEGGVSYVMEGNNISGSSDRGIYVGYAGIDTRYCNITRNNVTNSSIGIYVLNYIDGSNSIWNNFLANNTVNAQDNATQTNFWNRTKTAGTNIIGGANTGGNYYSDYTGYDSDGDGIGDTSTYTVSGSAGRIDYLPLTNTKICHITTTINLTANLTCPNGMNITSIGKLNTVGYNVTIIGALNASGPLNATGATRLNVTGDATIYTGVTVGSNTWTGASFFGSLTINSGGTYYATSGTTTITSQTSARYSIQNAGTFTHNNGLFKITTADSFIDMGGTGAGKDLYNFEDASSSIIYMFSNVHVLNTLNHTGAGALVSQVNGFRNITVDGNAYISAGRIGWYSSDPAYSQGYFTFGSLTIYSGGKFDATLQITNITNGNLINYGNFTAIVGTVNFASNATVVGINATYPFYKLNVPAGVEVTHKDNMAANSDVTLSGELESKAAGGLDFDGTDDYVDVGNGASIKNLGNITIEAWINPEGAHLQGYGGIYNHISGYGNSRLLIADDGSPLSEVYIGGSAQSIFGPKAINGSWNYIVYRYNGTHEVIFTNGIMGTSYAKTGAVNTGATNSVIGWGFSTHSYYHFNGKIDEVRIYNRSLSDSEIADHYHNNYPSETSLSGRWRLSEGTGQTTIDDSGNSNTGTLGNSGSADTYDPTWYSPNITIGSMNINAGGVYNATSGYTNISKYDGSTEYSLYVSGVFYHNSGTFLFSKNHANSYTYVAPGTNNFYNLEINSPSVSHYFKSDTNVLGSLNILSGALNTRDSWASTSEHSLNVTGAATVTGGIYAHNNNGGADKNQTFGALIVNSGASYDATNQITTITSKTTGDQAVTLNAGATVTHNNGKFKIQGNSFSYNEFYSFLYDLEIVVSGTNDVNYGRYGSSTVIAHDLTITNSRYFQGYNADDTLTVLNNVVVTDGILRGDTGTDTFGNLTVNPAGTLSATSGVTTIGNFISLNGTYTYNGGSINISGTNTKFATASGVKLQKVTSQPADLQNYHNISYYVNITNLTTTGGFGGNYFNITYTGTEPVNESKLQMWKHNGAAWTQTGITSTGVDTTNNWVWANISTFSIFAPLEERELCNILAGETVTLTRNIICYNLSIASTGILDANGYNVTVTNNMSITGTFTAGSGNHYIAGNLTLRGTLTAGTSTITVGGNWDSNPSTFTMGTSTVILNGTGTFTPEASYADRFYNVYLAYSGKITTLASTGFTENKLQLNSGIFAMGSADWYTYDYLGGEYEYIYGSGTITSSGGTIRLRVGGDSSILNNIIFIPYLSVENIGCVSNINHTVTLSKTLNAGTVYVVSDAACGYARMILDMNGNNVNASNIYVGLSSSTAGVLRDSLTGNLTLAEDLYVANLSFVNIAKGNMTVADYVNIDNGASIVGGTGNHTFGSLNINSGGTYNATSGITKITSYFVSGVNYAWYQAGTFIHNNGIVNLTSASTWSMYQAGTGNFYDLVLAATGGTHYLNYLATKIIVDHDLTVQSGGTYYASANSATNNFTVLGNVTINGGTLHGAGETVTTNASFGSLKINTGGTYNATNGKTTITSTDASNYGIYVNGGTFTRNTGLVNLTSSSSQWLSGLTGTNAFYNLDTYGGLKVFFNLNITGNLTIYSTQFRSYNVGDYLTVDGDAVVKNGAYLGESARTGNYSFSSLTVDSGATFHATSGITKIADYISLNGTYTYTGGSVNISGTNTKFATANNVKLQKVTSPPTDGGSNGVPLYNVGLYVNITNLTTSGGFGGNYFNITYTDGAVGNESKLQMWKHNGAAWTQTGIASTGVDTTNNWVWANISTFSSFAPMRSGECRNLTTSNTVYSLTSNLTESIQSGWNRCFYIEGTNITLDCNGHSLDGKGGNSNEEYGIYINNSDNVAIKNCTVFDYKLTQIYAYNVNNSNFTYNNVTRFVSIWAFGDGISVLGNSNRITNNSIYDLQKDGITISGNSNNVTYNNVTLSDNDGIFLNGPATLYNRITNNRVIDTHVEGLMLQQSSNNTIFDNLISSGDSNGILLSLDSDFNNITNNNITYNSAFGVQFASSDNNTVTNNNITDDYGVFVDLSYYNTFTSNSILSSVGSGILSSSGSYNTFNSNNVTGNNYSVYMSASSQNIFSNNRITNSDYGVYLTGSDLNNFTNDKINNTDIWDFYSIDTSVGNLIVNLTTNDTMSSFTYTGDMALDAATQPGAAPSGYSFIKHFLNLTNLSAGTWVYLNISYEHADLSNINNENTLEIWKNASGGWNQNLGTATNDVNIGSNYVYANISNFSSIFAPMEYLNAAPSITSLVLNSTYGTNYTNENLTAYVASSDANADSVTHIYNWYKNGQDFAVLNMPFDTNNVTTAKDYSSYGYNGNVYGAAWISAGKVGGAYNFDGVNDFINFTDQSFYPTCGASCTVPLTISLWIKLNETDQESAIVGRLDSSDSGHWYNYGSGIKYVNGNISAMGSNNGNHALINYTMTDTTSWHHVVAIVHTTQGKLYVDGVERASGDLSAGYVYKFSVGAQTNAGISYAFNGSIDDLRIYNMSLTAGQIKQMYLDTKDGYSSNSTVHSDETTTGENWSVTVTPNDGKVDGVSNTSHNLTIRNSLPVVSSVNVIPSPIDLTPCGNVSVNCTATIADTNGYADLNVTKAVLYNSDLTNSACTANNTKCYLNTSCIKTLCSGTSCTANCTFWDVRYYARGGNWKCNITVNDTAGASGSAEASVTLNNLTSIDISPTISFGAVDVNVYSNNISNNIRNCGNVDIDTQHNGTNMICTSNQIGVTNISYSSAQASGYVALNSTAMHLDINIITPINDTSSNKTNWWRLFVPKGVAGTCTGTATFIAVSNI